MIDLRVTTSARVCREADNGKTVHHVSFHPFEPVLACAVAAGRISLLEQARNYSGEPSPFCFWKETVSETGAKYPVKCLEWNADGTRFAAGYENGAVVVWDQTGRIVLQRRKHTSTVRCIRWNPAAFDIFATASNDGTAIVWDVTKRRSPQVQRIVAQDGKPVHDAAWIGENQLATVCSYDNDGLVHVWHLGRSAPVAELTHGDAVHSIRWSEHVKLLASASSAPRESVQIWSPSEPEYPIKRFRTSGSPVLAFDWLPGALTGPLVVCGCEDGNLVVWHPNADAGLGARETIQGHAAPVQAVSFSPDAKCLASIDQLGCLIIRLAKSWQQIYEARFAITNEACRSFVTWSGIGDMLVVSNQSSEVWLVEIGSSSRSG